MAGMEAKSPTRVDQADFTSTILVHNIHCASCVSYVKDVLQSISPTPTDVTANVLTHQVRVQHDPCVSPGEITGQLMTAGFELHSAFTEDATGQKILEASFGDAESHDDWLGHTLDRWSTRLSSGGMCSLPLAHDAPTDQEKQALHIQNCQACQVERRAAIKRDEKLPGKPHKQRSTSKSSNGLSSRRNGAPDDLESILLESGCQRDISAPSLGPYEGSDSSKRLSQQIPRSSTDGRQLVLTNHDAGSIIVDLGQDVSSSADDVSKEYDATLSIGGMTCASCTAAVTSGLEELPFVRAVNVNLLSNSATVKFSGPQESIKQISEKVENIGFDCSVDECSIIPNEKKLRGPPSLLDPQTTKFEIALSIGGMTCSSCTNTIDEGVKTLPFVQDLGINLLSNSAKATFTGRENADLIRGKIEDLGFDCSVEDVRALDPVVGEKQSEISRTIKIDGFFCEHCPPRVLEALRSTYGKKVSILQSPVLAKPIATVEYRPQAPNFTIRHILATINGAHPAFQAAIYHAPSMEERSQAIQLKDRRRLLSRLCLSVIVAIPTFLIGVVCMSLVHPSNPIRVFLERPLWGGEATRTDWALFILATPVMFFSAGMFHTKAIKEIMALWRPKSTVPLLRRLYRFGSMNLLMSAGTSVAYFSSLALLIVDAVPKHGGQMQSSQTSSYFDSVVFLTMFILIGRYLDAYSKAKAGDAVTMLGLLRPMDALLLEESTLDNPTSSIKDGPPDLRAKNVQKINSDLLEVGDIVRILHGSSPPADGIIVNGETRFDESALTGEARLVSKVVSYQVFAGTINKGKVISVQITGGAGSSMLDQIVKAVREGQSKRAPVERVADLITGYFVPVITLAAIVTFILWFSLGQSNSLPDDYKDAGTGDWAFWALEFAIAVFVVACPCGIGLAAPTALFVGTGLAAQHGILVKGGGEAFQEASNLDIVVFDKTGTLTEGGNPRVTDHDILPSEGVKPEDVWAIARALEESSSHPIARSVVSLCLSQTQAPITAADVEEVPGRGLRGFFHLKCAGGMETTKYEAVIGSEAFIHNLVGDFAKDYWGSNLLKWKSEAKSVALLALRKVSSSPLAEPQNFSLAAQFAITDPIRPEAASVISTLRKQGLHVYMLTGDNPQTASAVGSTIGIPVDNIIAGVLPDEKAETIKWLQVWGPKRGHIKSPGPYSSHKLDSPGTVHDGAGEALCQPHRRSVAMLGDGINDAPALAAASVSIAIGSGSDIALSTSKFVLLSSSPSKPTATATTDSQDAHASKSSLRSLLTLLALSRAVFRRVKFNFAWALVYNVCMVPLAAGVLYPIATGVTADGRETHWRLGPVWGSAAMALSSVSVVCSSLALRTGWVGVGFRAPKG